MGLHFRTFTALLLTAATLQSAQGVEFWSDADVKSSAGRLEQDAAAKGIAGKTLGAASIWRRATSGEAELHKTKTDLLVIEQGSATLVFGGTIPDARVSAPNELRGKSIRNGESRKLAPGDIIRIPAGTPHQFILEKGQQVAYFALKLTR
jgi:mannose-6-phosphate isomerase-like protein (cupin superfamily)